MIDRRQLALGEATPLPPRRCRHQETRRLDRAVLRDALGALGALGEATCDRCQEALRIDGRRVRENPRRD